MPDEPQICRLAATVPTNQLPDLTLPNYASAWLGKLLVTKDKMPAKTQQHPFPKEQEDISSGCANGLVNLTDRSTQCPSL